MANKKFTDLTQASTINETDIVATSQYSGGIWSSLKATISQIANKIVSGINYNSLSTTDKTIIGAINEAAQSGGSGGHTILDDDGTALSQEDNLQFVGVYSEDDSVNDTTKVNIVREMTQAQYELLSADEKKGIIRITDNNYVCESDEIAYDLANNVSVETELDSKEDWVSNGVLGAKNLNNYPYYETTEVKSNVTFTDVGDGTITATGTASSDAPFSCHSRIKGRAAEMILPNGKYRVSGCPSGGSDSKYRISVTNTKNGSANALAREYGEGAEFTVNGDDYFIDKSVVSVRCDVMGGYAISGSLTFKPMVTLVEDTDDTWRPYAMTNKQLTDVVNNVPDTAGAYTLQATRNADGTITYSWV